MFGGHGVDFICDTVLDSTDRHGAFGRTHRRDRLAGQADLRKPDGRDHRDECSGQRVGGLVDDGLGNVEWVALPDSTVGVEGEDFCCGLLPSFFVDPCKYIFADVRKSRST